MPIIIVKFVANHIRNELYRLYLNKIATKQPIMSENIGLEKGTRIIVDENLTSKNHGIFVEAGKYKKQGNLCQVFTHDGLVQVKAVKGKKPATIRSIRELDMFVQANPTMPQPAVNKENISNTNPPSTSINDTSKAGGNS